MNAKNSRRNSVRATPVYLRAWFALTVQERWFIAGVLAIVLIGLTARYVHLKNEQPEPYTPEGIERIHGGGKQ